MHLFQIELLMAIVYFSYLFICFSITEDNCIQCLSLFNFYASSFKFYSSKFCYFRYGDLKDLKKKKIFLHAPTPSYSSPAGFFLHTWQVLHIQKPVVSSRCFCRKQILWSPSNFCSNTYHWATHQDRLGRTQHNWVYLNY